MLRRSCVLVGMMLAVLALGACGGDDDKSGEDAGATQPQPTQAQPETPPEKRYQALIAGGEPLKRVSTSTVSEVVTLRFRDHEQANTRYRVCFQNQTRKDCKTRSTAAPDKFDDYKVTAELGRNLARWYVDGEEVARAVLKVEAETDAPTEDAPTEEPDGASGGGQDCGDVTVQGGNFSVSAKTYGNDQASPEPPSCSEAQAVVKKRLGTGSDPSPWSCETQTPTKRGDIVLECQRGASAGDILQARTNDEVQGGPE